MLRVTDDAAAMIQSLTDEAVLPDGGLRIAQHDEHLGLTMQLASSPQDEEDVLQAGGVQLFLDPIASTRLDGQTLDARTNESGSAFFLGT